MELCVPFSFSPPASTAAVTSSAARPCRFNALFCCFVLIPQCLLSCIDAATVRSGCLRFIFLCRRAVFSFITTPFSIQSEEPLQPLIATSSDICSTALLQYSLFSLRYIRPCCCCRKLSFYNWLSNLRKSELGREGEKTLLRLFVQAVSVSPALGDNNY